MAENADAGNKVKGSIMFKSFAALIILNVSVVNALTISTVLNDGQGNFDPWNQTRWAAWYSSGKLVKQFDINCSVTFADRGGESNPWEPDITGHESGRMFYITDAGRGVTVDGAGIFIDIRKTKPSLSQLYSSYWLYSEANRHPMQYCFTVAQNYNSTLEPTRIKNIWMKGFVQAIRTSFNVATRHPLIIEDCQFRRNQWGIYLSGNNAIVQNCGIKQNAKGGMYSGAGAHSNIIRNNSFQDNNYEQSKYYGDIAMDTAHYTTVENNTHDTPTGGSYQCGIKMYRNFGESGQLREHSTHHNIIRGNSFDGYSVAYDVGSRQGHLKDYDLSFEGRDYADYNLFEGNTITNTTVGIKLNCSSNTIKSNTFTNVARPIVLHCVFYSLVETVINDQAATDVYYWFVPSDYSTYSSWFPYQAQLSASVPDSQKLIHVRSDYGRPNFPDYTGAARIVIAPSLAVGSENFSSDLTGDQNVTLNDISNFGRYWLNGNCGESNQFCNKADLNFDGRVDDLDLSDLTRGWLGKNDIGDVYSSGAVPIDFAVGDFWAANPGDEIAVIWDTPVSNVGGTSYYSIIIYDGNGIEINRCGRSTVKWQAITAGNFVNLVGTYSVVETGDEIAAVPASAVGGYYPVYVFARGRKDPTVTLMTTNTTKIVGLAGGNFKTTGDTNDEIAVIFEGGSTTIKYCKPTEPTWTATTTGAANLTKIAAGNFDGSTTNGDEIAAINAASSIIYYYRVSAAWHYGAAATAGLPVWADIAGGNFDGAAGRDEVAVVSSAATAGVYKISYYIYGASAPFKYNDHDALAAAPIALEAGKAVVGSPAGRYEQAKGFYSDNYNQALAYWGDFAVAIPSTAGAASVPVFWLNANLADSTNQYLKVVPISR